jgi:UDP-N-acetylmuramoyl-tripeptide--D-alanyl-D-alanine ligase
MTEKELKELHEIFLKHPKITRDSREVQEGDIFWALKGEKFDGNKFARQALEKGAHIAVVDDKKLDVVKEKRFFLVDDTLKALQDFGNFHRQYIGMPAIGITGSNGKTTTKELVNAVLSVKYNTSATYKNYNNHIGVPLTLLEIPENTDVAIIEMGTNHFGEIKTLCQIADPDFALITSIGKAHLEEFKDLNGVKKEKGALFEHIRQKNGIIFLNIDDKDVRELGKGIHSFSFSYHNHPEANILLQDITEANTLSVQLNQTEIHTKLTGKYNLSNIGYAITVGKFFNLQDDEIKEALENYVPKDMRSQIIEKNNNIIILDTYNANPTSMMAALENLLQRQAKRKVAVLGDMFELGESAFQEHQKIADFLAENHIEAYLIGTLFSKTKTKFKTYPTTEKFIASKDFNKITQADILIKGSRSMALEKILSP